MGYTQVALEDRILDMYPEIREKGIHPKMGFDEEKNCWAVTLEKGGRSETVYLSKEDADACMDRTYCESFGKEVGEAIEKIA
ncbi:MAG: hypothetical protein PVG55_01140 [Nitrospirota bacterium]|jgi:hypothetical protein